MSIDPKNLRKEIKNAIIQVIHNLPTNGSIPSKEGKQAVLTLLGSNDEFEWGKYNNTGVSKFTNLVSSVIFELKNDAVLTIPKYGVWGKPDSQTTPILEISPPNPPQNDNPPQDTENITPNTENTHQDTENTPQDTENTPQDTEIATQPIKTPEIATQPVKTPEIDGQKSDLDIFLDTLPQPLSKEEGLLRIVVRQKGLGILTQPIKDMGGSVKDGGCYGAYGSLAVFHCDGGVSPQGKNFLPCPLRGFCISSSKKLHGGL